jgi:hypothetical protein
VAERRALDCDRVRAFDAAIRHCVRVQHGERGVPQGAGGGSSSDRGEPRARQLAGRYYTPLPDR